MTTLTKDDLADLKRAKSLLENPGLAAKLSSMLGSPVEKGMKMLPSRWQKSAYKATEGALMKALDVAVTSLGERPRLTSQDKFHRLAAAASGAAGGAFGLAALSWELPLSTTLMLRSIADIAASEGENPRHIDTKLACLTVFALGSGRDKRDDAANSGYFATRAALASAVSEASAHLARKGLSKSGAPAVVRLVSAIGARFGVVVSEKAAVQSIPIIGAAGGAVVNTLFIGHYQDMARGHFIVRRLEKIHGAEPVRTAYAKV
ncbi:MAG: EcsC family protein [Betaproteobacteria bacterium]|nr:EcsC family protein [Betaproteobacteria bacterium]